MGCNFISICTLTPDAQAAWVQAVGSVMAIMVAVLIAWSQARSTSRLQQADRDRQAGISAAALATVVQTIVVESTIAADLAKKLLASARSAANTFTLATPEAIGEKLKINSAPSLDLMLAAAMFLEKEVAQGCIVVVESTRQVNRIAALQLASLAGTVPASTATKIFGDLEVLFSGLTRQAEAAMAHLSSIHGMAPKGLTGKAA